MTKTHLVLAAAVLLGALALLAPSHGALVAAAAPPTVTAVHAPSGHTAPSTATRVGPVTLTAQLSQQRVLPNQELFAKVQVVASTDTVRPAAPVSVVLVLDRSGSMAGEKMERARAAARALVEQLGPADELGLVAFDSAVEPYPLTAASPEGKAALRARIDRIDARGGTFISGGLAAAQRMLEAREVSGRTRRVVLVSDGQPTEGELTAEALSARAQAMHAAGLAVSALGVGVDFDQRVMRGIADQGAGFYAFLENAGALEGVLGKELALARSTLATEVEVTVEVAEGFQLLDVPGRRFTRQGLREARFTLPDLGPGHDASAYVRLKTQQAAELMPVSVRVHFHDPAQPPVQEASVQVSAGVALDADDALASRDSRLEAEGLRAVGTVQVVAAAAAYERGDKESALSMLDGVRRLLGTSADALAGEERADLEKVAKGWEATSDPRAMRVGAMNLANKKMSNFGENNTY